MAQKLENLSGEPERIQESPETTAEIPPGPEKTVERKTPSRAQEAAAPPSAAGSAAGGVIPLAKELEKIRQKPRPDQIKALVEIAFDKGVPQAVELAKSLDAYNLDEFHDTLVDELREQLIKEGKIKEI